MKKKTLRFILLIILVTLVAYLAFNYKELKQTFVNGFNDGKAKKAKEEKK